MNCADIRRFSPLRSSGELEAPRCAAFDEHVAGCPACAKELQRQRVEDDCLRTSMAAESAWQEPTAQSVKLRVMREIARERFRHRMLPGMMKAALATAALATAALLVLTVTHPAITHNVPPNPTLFRDAARDHTTEVIRQMPRHWKTDSAEIAALEASQGIPDADVRAVEATGYRVQRAKICHLDGRAYMHVVYAKQGREFSVFLRVTGEQAGTESGSSDKLQLASFPLGGLKTVMVQAVIVTDAARGECERFALEAEAAL